MFSKINSKCDSFIPFEVFDMRLQIWLHHPFAYSLENPCEGNYIQSRTPFWGCTFSFPNIHPLHHSEALCLNMHTTLKLEALDYLLFRGDMKKRMLCDSLKNVLSGLDRTPCSCSCLVMGLKKELLRVVQILFRGCRYSTCSRTEGVRVFVYPKWSFTVPWSAQIFYS